MGKSNKLLAIVTNVGEYDRVGYRTGLWLGELTHFWDVAESAGFELEIASPSGGYIPIDPESLAHEVLKEHGTAERYADRAFMDRLKNTMRVGEARSAQYDGIYLTGGHGVCYDFPHSRDLASLIARFYESGKIVSAVCHGPAGLLDVKLSSGEHLIAGKKVTGFSSAEEKSAERAEWVPYDLEVELKKRGGDYSKAAKQFAEHVVVDGLLITGQNPASAKGVGEAVVQKLLTKS